MKIILEKGNLDADNDILVVEGIQIKENLYPIYKDYNFNSNSKPISFGKVYKQNGLLMCESDIPEEELLKYPTIGYKIIDKEINKLNGFNILKSELVYVGVSLNPNLDASIKTLKEQLDSY